ncbi:Meiotic nuclear division protein 1-like [Gracilariopsis chorda]|uniref:Meiotic nuclear division protein 1-like n=1 Tax=Gracilariopsis chorda TaxID=448386 RepID=A0A2V3IF79_9FLOR|nr:Meiotic nuclear division protein 1-like [Gracilariopsis chorda]|eukprot:PXF40724.1 Meiotic nuclear division protein 1-like [Gracilariopsis chorda]
MAPTKVLSFDEKRERLMELFTVTAKFFTLKELEKIAPNRKGLVDDNMVNTDKSRVQTVF